MSVSSRHRVADSCFFSPGEFAAAESDAGRRIAAFHFPTAFFFFRRRLDATSQVRAIPVATALSSALRTPSSPVARHAAWLFSLLRPRQE